MATSARAHVNWATSAVLATLTTTLVGGVRAFLSRVLDTEHRLFLAMACLLVAVVLVVFVLWYVLRSSMPAISRVWYTDPVKMLKGSWRLVNTPVNGTPTPEDARITEDGTYLRTEHGLPFELEIQAPRKGKRVMIVAKLRLADGMEHTREVLTIETDDHLCGHRKNVLRHTLDYVRVE